MSEDRTQLGSRMVAAMPGWLLLLGGLALVGLAVLTPKWLELRELAWERDLVALQAERLEAQAERYESFEQALAEGDPVLLERLALTQLRMVRQDLELMRLPAEASGHGRVPLSRVGESLVGPQLEAAVDDWLAEPLPEVGRDIAPLEPVDTRLVRLARQPRSRGAMLAAGLACVVGGVWWGVRSG